jgi:uncharacterized membrane protein YgdD (TMEM256/DUF423 family)
MLAPQCMMYKWANIIIGLAALSGAAGIMESAASAHTITDPLLKTSANILIFNAAAVIAVGVYALNQSQRWALFGAATLLAGSLLFCGELTTHVFFGQKFFAFAAPVGGLLMITGWLIAAANAFASALRPSAKI